MSQRLILPINELRITAGYKNANYKKQFGYNHYGMDCTHSDRKTLTVWGSGIGEVTHCGDDAVTGNTVVVIYKDCELPNGKKSNIAIRYYHLKAIKVKVGQKVSKDTILGEYGNTGASAGAHLHIECDTDIVYPNYSPQVSKNGTVIKAGTDTTLNPVNVLWAKTTKPDYQRAVLAGYNTTKVSDREYKITT